MRRVLFVSKPVLPPWSDSSKNLVRDLALGIDTFHLHVMGSKAAPFERSNVSWEPIYRGTGRYAPALSQNARVFLRLARPDPVVSIYHFFFAPNRVTSGILGGLMRLKSQRTVQTVCSVPQNLDSARKLLFSDRVVAVSDSTASALTNSGVAGVRRIYPCIDPDRLSFRGRNDLAHELNIADAPVVLYPGDLEHLGVPELLLRALARIRERISDVVLVVAARQKNARTVHARHVLLSIAREMGLLGSLRLLAEVDRVDQLLALATLVIMPVPTLYRKMDIPLVLLEAMAQELPVIVSDLPPLRELIKGDSGLVVPKENADALAQAAVTLLTDSDRQKRVGFAARLRVLEEFTIHRASRSYETLYEELLSE